MLKTLVLYLKVVIEKFCNLSELLLGHTRSIENLFFSTLKNTKLHRQKQFVNRDDKS